MRDFIIFIVKNLVDYPDQVILDQEQDGERIMFNDKHAQALRTLLVAVAAKEGMRAGLEIAD